MGSRLSLEEQLEALPFNMSAKDVAEFLKIGLSTAYKLIDSEDFPKLSMPGSRLIRIPKHLFIDWYKRQCEK